MAATVLSMIFALLMACVSVAGDTIYSCFGVNKTLNIDCGAGYMVHITKTFYGFSPTSQCRLVEGEAGAAGCTVEDHENYPCVGQRTCSINLPTGAFGVNVPTCGQRSNYFQVEYNCVLESSVTNICNNEKLTKQSGYIMTPKYPAKYKYKGDCYVDIVAHPSQKINLNIIELDLESRGRTDCADLMYFNDKLRSITLCGQRTNNSYSMLSNFLHIELQSSSAVNSKGFWLYYEAVPPMPTSLTPSTVVENKVVTMETLHFDNNQAVTSGPRGMDRAGNSILLSTLQYQQANTTVPLFYKKNSPKLPFAAIAGGVIGTLSLILVLLLLLLLIKWCNERKYYKGEKVLEIRNPAFRSSNDFHESQNQNSNYC
ncbi:hypothetical protein BgiMline_015218 [Biomphalaria glabrata]|uniref:Uncharacterized protein LOC106057503 n=1 Tax=Biomphalaria glabrata TaxID=6526 RepID=A0A2C9LYI0_BIOGL|nr:uncharacterized protein LOC106057503 [Biomphalaria glabrata]XP_013070171.1 uncharacterized protein LOC106057503 [Biomphalaria glabrata]KAI8742556.1 mannan-binding lectin serine protease 2 [Biomphalaria glabrata]KAI8772683.1 mannan-binding lectin serine protease 2 [Biomphalaria glabrata]